MRENWRYFVLVGSMVIAFAWSYIQGTPSLEGPGNPLPSIASTVGTGPAQN